LHGVTVIDKSGCFFGDSIGKTFHFQCGRTSKTSNLIESSFALPYSYFLVLLFFPYGKLLKYFDLSVAENYIIDCLQKQLLALERDVDQYKHFQPNDPAFKTKAMLQ
jgi:hypothetical protein